MMLAPPGAVPFVRLFQPGLREQQKNALCTEVFVDRPVSLDAATKKSNELMAYTYSHLYRIPATSLRFFTVYGP
jgi:UDP-glucuronate 4-epimerase